MKSNEMVRYCAIKKNGNFRVIDTYYMTDSERVFLLLNLIDDKTEKHLFNYSEKILSCYKIQKNIEYYKSCLSFAKTIDERHKYHYELNNLQSLLNDMILSLRI